MHFSIYTCIIVYNSKDSIMINTRSIAQIAEIRFGFYSISKDKGDLEYFQVRQFDDLGRRTHTTADFINSDEKTENHLLKDGDVLFVGKGNRLFSWCYRQQDRPAVASSIFFVLRLSTTLVLPEYLAAILNAPQSKATFQQIGAGTNIFSIRKSELGAFQIPLPSMKQQKLIADIAQLHQQEILITQQLITQKQELYSAIISNLIK